MKYNNKWIIIWLVLSIFILMVNLWFGLGWVLGSLYWDKLVIKREQKGK